MGKALDKKAYTATATEEPDGGRRGIIFADGLGPLPLGAGSHISPGPGPGPGPIPALGCTSTNPESVRHRCERIRMRTITREGGCRSGVELGLRVTNTSTATTTAISGTVEMITTRR